PLAPDSPVVGTSRAALQDHLGAAGDRIPFVAHYAGQLRQDDELVLGVAVNTDNRPIIEYVAPVNHRRERAGQVSWFVAEDMLEFMSGYVNGAALTSDTYLSELDTNWYRAIQAGYYLHVSYVLEDKQREDAAEAKQIFHDQLAQAARVLVRGSTPGQ
ncbi:MAG: hypothetical protein AAF993_10905, partial [Pseudomonadota bacterium]